MARSDPEKLAQALRANLKRRKAPAPAARPEPASLEGPKDPAMRPEKPAQP